jgi:hypothetical protein
MDRVDNIKVLARLSGLGDLGGDVVFTQTSRCAGGADYLISEGQAERFYIGVRDAGGGGFSITFKAFRVMIATLEVADDAWHILVGMPELLVWLAKHQMSSNQDCVAPSMLRQALLDMGYIDLSRRQREPNDLT